MSGGRFSQTVGYRDAASFENGDAGELGLDCTFSNDFLEAHGFYCVRAKQRISLGRTSAAQLRRLTSAVQPRRAQDATARRRLQPDVRRHDLP